jgi:hypothetical protein
MVNAKATGRAKVFSSDGRARERFALRPQSFETPSQC